MPQWNARALPWLCTAWLVAAPALGAAAAPPPSEAFGGMPAETDPALSPDGHWLAWVDNNEAQPRVIMFDVQARKIQRAMAVSDATKLRGLRWNDNETLIIMLSETRISKAASQKSEEFFRYIAQDVTGGDGRMLPMNTGTNGVDDDRTGSNLKGGLRRPGPALAYLRASRLPKPKTVIMETYGKCAAVVVAQCLLEVDTRTGVGTVIKVGNRFTGAFYVDHDGRPLAREDWDYQQHAFRVYAYTGETVREILRSDDAERPAIAGLLADGSALVLLASNGRPHQAAWAVPLDGSPQRLLADDPNADITGVWKDPYTGAVVGVYLSGTTSEIRWLDPVAEQRHAALQRTFAGRQIVIYDWTADGTKTLAQVMTPSSPPVYYLVDFANRRADIVAEEYPSLSGVTLGEFKSVTYKARDGTAIPAYLTMPVSAAAKPAPLVVLPHGGPHARDYPAFDWIVQFLASRGYAVLQPQFRGSTGFGDAFREAGYRQWGGLMQDDVSDGVRAMVEQGIADPHRVCIVGASYGGYAALAGAAFTPDLYKCAVSIAGVSNLRALLESEIPEYGGWGGSTSAGISVWKKRIGEPNDPKLDVKSPINSVKSIKIPVLIIYGTGDGVVPTEQSQRMVKAMTAAGKDVQVAVLSGEDHWLSRSVTRLQVLQALEAFLKVHL